MKTLIGFRLYEVPRGPTRQILLWLMCAMFFSCTSDGFAQNIDRRAWPNTDFSRTSIDLREIISGGPGKDGIPAIDQPRFVALSEYQADPLEPVIGVTVNGEAKAYPLRVMIWHEIVNDEIGGVPVSVTYCPLCNTSVIFDRRLQGRVLDFGTTGYLRHSDLIMYDRQTESWWQQYGGTGVVGEYSGQELQILASRLESLQKFRERAPDGKVLVPNNPRARNYNANPYAGYDRSAFPFLFNGDVPSGVSPMMRVVAVENTAVTLPLLMEQKTFRQEDLLISWEAGQRTALGNARIDRGEDVGNVTVTRNNEDVPHVVTFAFAFFAFNPQGTLHTENGPVTPQ
ncbi:MAG: DUF3179 domain-containing protein [Pseudomonadales bacterium]|nr:DUF3179 domain-containing protein [Pseudomonadales bacterium]